MEKQCAVCGSSDGKYKCPTCLVYYCCVGCCQAHRKKGCGVVTDPTRTMKTKTAGASSEAAGTGMSAHVKYPTPDTVFPEMLEKLKDDKTISNLLCNPHLRNYLVEVNESSNPEDMMQKAMQEPIFVEFSKACLKVVKPSDPNLKD